MLNLDSILRHLGEPPVHGVHMHPVTDAELRELIAELGAAREVIGPAKAIYEDGSYDPVLFAELGTAIDAYNKVAGGGS